MTHCVDLHMQERSVLAQPDAFALTQGFYSGLTEGRIQRSGSTHGACWEVRDVGLGGDRGCKR